MKIEIYVAELNEVNELGCLRWKGRGRDYGVSVCGTNAESEFLRE